MSPEVLKPYRTTMVFDERTLPNALRREHSTKSGVWGLVRVLQGELWLRFADGRELLLHAGAPGLVRPQEVHWVEPVEHIQMQVEFYDGPPAMD